MPTLTPATVQECNGAAHSNPFIDHCMVCLPSWGKIYRCPADNTRLTETTTPTLGYVGYCPTCRKHYAI